jgi:hypothetical protein
MIGLRCFAVFALWIACVSIARAEDGPHGSTEWTGRRIEELTAQLRDDEYLRREDASRKLADAPASVLPIVERLAQDAEDPEASQRLLTAARAIFRKQIAELLPEWRKGRGFLGIRWTIGPDAPGVIIQEVIPNTAADEAGLQNGDVILSANGSLFEQNMTHDEAMRIWRQMIAGDQLNLVVKKAEKEEPVKMTVTVKNMPTEYQYDTSEVEKEEKLWNRYREGRLQLPRELKGDSPAAVESNRLQSWPREFQAPPKSTPK